MFKTVAYVLAGLLVLALIFATPLAVIWALNTLFPVLNIPYNLYTYLAVVVIGGFARANVSVGSFKNQ